MGTLLSWCDHSYGGDEEPIRHCQAMLVWFRSGRVRGERGQDVAAVQGISCACDWFLSAELRDALADVLNEKTSWRRLWQKYIVPFKTMMEKKSLRSTAAGGRSPLLQLRARKRSFCGFSTSGGQNCALTSTTSVQQVQQTAFSPN